MHLASKNGRGSQHLSPALGARITVVVETSPKSIHLDAHTSLDVAGLTHVGRERQRNEDQFMIARLERSLRVEATSIDNAQQWLAGSTEGTVMLVADGMGGTAAGDVASSVAVKAIADYVVNVLPWADARSRAQAEEQQPLPAERPEPTLHGIRIGLSKALVEGDAEVRREAKSRGAGSMGTTLTVAYVQWPHLYVAHAGDSRCYLKRAGNLAQLTTDHTLAEKLRAHADELSIDESSPWHHVLWNALGGGEHSSIEPEVHRQRLQFGDTILLCSDGLTKHVADVHIAAILQSSPHAAHACETLMRMALEDGGTDNITVVVARCRVKQERRTRRTTDPLEHTLPITPDIAASAHEDTENPSDQGSSW